ncbi:MAG: DUF1553 domain-containing protein [Candidatus Hydrogenedens sp.]|nr:DUF1553 domain-containing protein [Candidatus Hydrogenedens sp.]
MTTLNLRLCFADMAALSVGQVCSNPILYRVRGAGSNRHREWCWRARLECARETRYSGFGSNFIACRPLDAGWEYLPMTLKKMVAWAMAWGIAAGPVSAAEPITFDEHIRPILSNKCFACHGPDEATRKAGLRLDFEDSSRAELASGEFAIVPGKLEESAVHARIHAADRSDRMPPASFKKDLTEEEIALLDQWIQEGAAYQKHWSFVAPERPEPPAITDPSLAFNPIDQFIVSRLEKDGLSPSPLADKRSIIRRVTLDLTGLPPTVEEVEAFAGDESPDAYERLVDRLLASPRYGEHMARYWLDAARYADTNGYHIDNERYMWRWRDWVIDAYNNNMPFDEFTIDQLAGDLLENPTVSQRIASGFNRNHMINFEGGIIAEEYRNAYVVDRVNTTGTVWMGLTIGCAQCHTHKYDPITHDEYYEFYAYFNTIEEQGIDGRDGNSMPLMKAPRQEDLSRIDALTQELQAALTELEKPDEELDAKQGAWEHKMNRELGGRWEPIKVVEATSSGGADLNLLPDGTILASGTAADDDTYTLVLETPLRRITGIRLEALTHESFNGRTGRAPNGNFVLTDVKLGFSEPGSSAEPLDIPIVGAEADYAQPDFPVSLAIDGDPATGWAANGQERAENRMAVFLPERPVGFGKGARLTLKLTHASQFKQHAIGRFRIRVTTDEALRPSQLGTWQANGPYLAEDGKTAYDTAYPPEQGVDLAATYEDGRAKWSEAPWVEDGKVLTLPGNTAAYYLYREIHAFSDRTMDLDLASNDALKVWLNGEVVHDNNVQRGIEEGKYDRIKLPLKEGDNTLLVKVVNYGNKYEFYFTRSGEQYRDVPLPIEAILASRPSARSEGQQKELLHYFRGREIDGWADQKAAYDQLVQEKQQLEANAPTVMVMAEMAEPRETFVLERGAYDKPANRVEPATPAALPPLPAEFPNNRLGLARWLVSREHPLTSRVTVNRMWQEVFGTGLVKTAEDFGSQGEAPTHPKLLDWLAVEFMDSGWDVKALMKVMVMSRTYRQDSRATPEMIERDRPNRLLARAPRYRLDAEVLRDTALAASGLLVEKLGGPSVKPYQPPGIWEEVSYGAGFTAQEYTQDTGEGLYRRSMYTFWKRQAPPARMVLFDAPNRETCSVKRSRTNTPLQALGLMNDPQFVEASRVLAQRALTEADASPEARIAFLFETLTAREPAPEELQILSGLLDKQQERYAADTGAAAGLIGVGDSAPAEGIAPEELAAWTTIASVILNLDETISKS